MTTNILTAIVSAYCACTICCGSNAKGITASGNKPIEGLTVAIPRRYPLGSRVFLQEIPEHRNTGNSRRDYYLGLDRTASKYDGRVDVYFKNHLQAKKFGIKTNKVIIITP